MNEVQLLHELTPVAEQLTARHYETCKPWYPHEFVPWSLGRDMVMRRMGADGMRSRYDWLYDWRAPA